MNPWDIFVVEWYETLGCCYLAAWDTEYEANCHCELLMQKPSVYEIRLWNLGEPEPEARSRERKRRST